MNSLVQGVGIQRLDSHSYLKADHIYDRYTSTAYQNAHCTLTQSNVRQEKPKSKKGIALGRTEKPRDGTELLIPTCNNVSSKSPMAICFLRLNNNARKTKRC